MRPLSGAMCYPKWQVKGVLAAPVASPGPVGLCAAPWAPRSSAESLASSPTTDVVASPWDL